MAKEIKVKVELEDGTSLAIKDIKRVDVFMQDGTVLCYSLGVGEDNVLAEPLATDGTSTVGQGVLGVLRVPVIFNSIDTPGENPESIGTPGASGSRFPIE